MCACMCVCVYVRVRDRALDLNTRHTNVAQHVVLQHPLRAKTCVKQK